MAKEFIVALELGSSKITGIAGKKNSDGSISILAVVKENSSGCIRKGVVYNIDKTALCLTNILNKLKTQLKSEIARVYIGVSGRGVRSVRNVIVKELPPESVVTQTMVDEIMDANRNMSYPDYEIIDAATQEFKVGSQLQLEPVGIPTSHLEGNFLNIIGKLSYSRTLNKCFDSAGIAIAERYLAPNILAEAVLTETERRTGCLLVDLGADTTTVSVYYRDILRHLSVIPLGSNNITKDLASLQMDEEEAEQMKLKYANAYTDNADLDEATMLPIDTERSISKRVFVECVEARVKEIVENAWVQVPTELSDKLLGGIILTGGGSNLPNIDLVFRQTTHLEKIRFAKFVNANITISNTKIDLPHDATMNTALALIMKGNMDSAGSELSDNLFDDKQKASAMGQQQQTAASEGYNHSGEQGFRGSENTSSKPSTEPNDHATQDEKDGEKDKPKKKNSRFNKLGNSLKGFIKVITSPEQDE